MKTTPTKTYNKKFLAIEAKKPWRDDSFLVEVYQVKRNELEYIGSFKNNYAAHKGNESEVLNFLAQEKVIPQKYKNQYYNWKECPYKITYKVPTI